MKVKVTEEPAWKRILEIEVDSTIVQKELDQVVEDYRRRLNLPGFRKGTVPADLARKHLGDDLEGEVLRRVLPQAFEDAVKDAELKPIGDPHISNLKFNPGEPLFFTATVEVLPQVEIKGYEGLKLTRVQPEIQEEDLSQVLDHLRDQHADLEEVDRPAQGDDVIVIHYREIDEQGQPVNPDEEAAEMSLTLGAEQTPATFNQELMGAVIGDMKKIPLPYPPDYPDEAMAGQTRFFHTTVTKIQEKIWPALDDAFARKILGTEDAGTGDLKSRIRLNLEVEARMNSMRTMENNLISRLLEMNPFDLPEGVVESTLDRVVEQARKDNPNLSSEEEQKIREQYRLSVEQRYRGDILIDTVGRDEGIEITDEELDNELDSFAKQEGKKRAQVKAELKRQGNLDRLREDLYKRRVLDRLVEKADITVTTTGAEQEEKT